PWCHPHQFMQVLIGKERLGYFSVMHPEVAQRIELNKPVAVWELNLTLLQQYSEDKLKYKTLSKYPSIELDLSILVSEKTAWQDIQKLVLAVDPKIIKTVRLLDVYKNDKIEVGKKSVTFRIVYLDEEKTLEMEFVSTLQKKIVEQLKKAVSAEVRQ
ncbi:MAG: Phenylalanine-tRNA ligase beta subunit, partial [Parcubacteria group bacterium GW2011_GWC2_38_7]